MIRRGEITNPNHRGQKTISGGGTYIVQSTDEILYVDATAGNTTLTLPDAVGAKDMNLQVKKIDSTQNTVTLSPVNSQKIDQVTSMIIYNQNDLVEINSDGTNWQTLSIPSSITNAPFALTAASTVNIDPAVVGQLGVLTLTPGQAETINAPSPVVPNQRLVLVITTSGTTSFTLTFGTNFKSTGTLATGTVSGKVFVIEFISDGVNYNEVARTTAM